LQQLWQWVWGLGSLGLHEPTDARDIIWDNMRWRIRLWEGLRRGLYMKKCWPIYAHINICVP
jgi:hypothetical protein